MYTKFPLLCTPLCQHATHLSSKWLISFLKCSLLTSIDHMWHVLSQYVNKVHPPFDKIPKTIYNILPFSSTFLRKINFELWNSYNPYITRSTTKRSLFIIVFEVSSILYQTDLSTRLSMFTKATKPNTAM